MDSAGLSVQGATREPLDVLRDALTDDADNLEAAELYETTLRNLGDDDGIAEATEVHDFLQEDQFHFCSSVTLAGRAVPQLCCP